MNYRINEKNFEIIKSIKCNRCGEFADLYDGYAEDTKIVSCDKCDSHMNYSKYENYYINTASVCTYVLDNDTWSAFWIEENQDLKIKMKVKNLFNIALSFDGQINERIFKRLYIVKDKDICRLFVSEYAELVTYSNDIENVKKCMSNGTVIVIEFRYSDLHKNIGGV